MRKIVAALFAISLAFSFTVVSASPAAACALDNFLRENGC